MEDLKLIRIFEDRKTKLKLSPNQINDILSMKAILGENNLDLQADGNLLIRHYVGFAQINGTRLLIYPKIAKRVEDEEGFEKAFGLLVKLLNYSNFSNIKRLPVPQYMGKYKGDLLELFIGIFVDELIKQYKRDVNKDYSYTVENQSFIKGKIDFGETIKKNSYRWHLHYVKFDHFTENILLNQIFKAILENLMKRTRVNENIHKIKLVLLWLEDVQTIRLHIDIWNRVKFTRLNRCYEPVFNMAKLFYFNSGPNLNKGKELVFSFLVPLNQLFEQYVYELIHKNIRIEEDFKVRYQGPTSYLATLEDKDYLQLRPDITISQGKKIKLILDAKYKEIVDEDGKIDPLHADVYQMLAYSVHYQCDDIVLVYPKFLDCGKTEMLLSRLFINNYDRKLTILVVQLDLEEQEESSYGRLVDIIEDSHP